MNLEEKRKGLVCLVPKPGDKHVLTSHEKTLCDCQVLEIIDYAERLEKALIAIHVSCGAIYIGSWKNTREQFRKMIQESGIDVNSVYQKISQT